jgi:hypothetical protein
MDEFENWISTTEAANRLGLSAGMLRVLTKDREDEFHTRKVGRALMWRKDEIEMLAKEREAKQGRGQG